MPRAPSTRHPDADAIEQRVLYGIAGNRIPGLHFPAYFIGIALPAVDADGIRVTLPCGPHLLGAGGQIDLAALCLLADNALATATRRHVADGARLATLRLQLQFTGLPVGGDVHAQAQPLGQFADTAVRQLLAQATMSTADGVVFHASGEFAALDPPPGVALAPLPWQYETPPQPVPLSAPDLDADEKPILRACRRALAQAVGQPAFVEQFWGGIPVRRADGARLRFGIGPHLTNRVGHVQGGISVGIAARCACAAVPAGMALSNITAWYISPGRGKSLAVKSRVVHAGKTIAVVRTEVKTDSGARVLEVVTHHVARKRD